MSAGVVVNIIICVVLLAIIGLVVYWRLPKKLKTTKFVAQWKELQAQLAAKENWPKALADADKMLDYALRKRKFKGKSMGERMVSAQKAISNNDAMWFAHNLNKKLISDPTAKLKEVDVKNALLGYRAALKDIGALQMPQKPVADNKEEPKA